MLGHSDTIAFASWPTYDPQKVVSLTVNMAVSVNGKLRATIEVEKDLEDGIVQELALKQEGVIRHTEGKTIKKIIIVKNKIINIVVV